MSEHETRGGDVIGTEEGGRLHPLEPAFGQLGQGLDELVAEGKVGDPVPQGMYLALLGLMGELKARRESMGLSLTDASERSGMTRQAISKLENGHNTNPTLASLWKYAGALEAEVAFAVQDAEEWDDPDEPPDPTEGTESIFESRKQLADEFEARIRAANIDGATDVVLILHWFDEAGREVRVTREDPGPKLTVEGGPAGVGRQLGAALYLDTLIDNMRRIVANLAPQTPTMFPGYPTPVVVRDIELEIIPA